MCRTPSPAVHEVPAVLLGAPLVSVWSSRLPSGKNSASSSQPLKHNTVSALALPTVSHQWHPEEKDTMMDDKAEVVRSYGRWKVKEEKQYFEQTMSLRLIDCVKKVLHPTQHKIGHFGDVPQRTGMEKLNLTQQKRAFINQKKCTKHKTNTKTVKPDLVTSYNIRSGNGEGTFLFWCFINLSLTYLLIHLPTYLQPQDPCRADNEVCCTETQLLCRI